MYAATTRQDNLFSFDPALRLPMAISVLFHIMVVIVFTVGLPFIRPPVELTNTPITIEIATIADITQTTKLAPPKKVDDKKPEQAPPEENLKPPEVKEEKPPEIAEPKPPEPEKIDQEKPKPEPKKEEKKPEEKPKEKPKPPEPKKVEEKPKEEPKKDEDLDSLLKNVLATPPEATETAEAVEETTPEQAIDTPNLGPKMTLSEKDAFQNNFRNQFKPCWNIPIGAKDAETLLVDLQIYVGPDKNIQRAIILDQARYNQEPAFKAMADSAIRALQNPICHSPLQMPDGFSNFKVTFDPREML